jgi:hypothetical protein
LNVGDRTEVKELAFALLASKFRVMDTARFSTAADRIA